MSRFILLNQTNGQSNRWAVADCPLEQFPWTETAVALLQALLSERPISQILAVPVLATLQTKFINLVLAFENNSGYFFYDIYFILQIKICRQGHLTDVKLIQMNTNNLSKLFATVSECMNKTHIPTSNSRKKKYN